MTTLSELLQDRPAAVEVTAAQVAEARVAAGEHTVYVVLDDDPTGTQSVADLPVLTAWEVEDFRWAFATGAAAVYVMTNSRSLSPEDAERVNREVVSAALAAAGEIPVSFVSRSDSTLRGHFPLEPQTIAAEIRQAGGADIDGVVVVPAFGDAGRITIGGVHYAGSESAGFVPVGESEFARDATFGYRSSRLAQWVEEKTDGEIPADSVIHIDLTTLRTDLDAVVELLRSARNGAIITVDIVAETDLRQLSLALIRAEAQGSHFIYRVGPPFTRARIGQAVHAPVTLDEIRASRGARELALGGLVVVGSHVALTSRQLEQLRKDRQPQELVLDVASVIDDATRDAHVAEIAERAAAALSVGTVVVSTSRTVIKGADGASSLSIARRVSDAVVEVVQRVLAQTPPRFVVAKGGITSSDVATRGLGIRHANVVGPMLPGIVSLWSGQDGPAAGIPYVVFAGNVGDDTSLSTVVDKLTQA